MGLKEGTKIAERERYTLFISLRFISTLDSKKIITLLRTSDLGKTKFFSEMFQKSQINA